MTQEGAIEVGSPPQAGTPDPDEQELVAAVVRRDRKATAEFVG